LGSSTDLREFFTVVQGLKVTPIFFFLRTQSYKKFPECRIRRPWRCLEFIATLLTCILDGLHCLMFFLTIILENLKEFLFM
jgi:hypothetical protein